MGIARSYAGGTDASDLFQEMLLQIWKSLPTFESRSSENTWVYRVALNTAMSYRRNESRRLRRVVVDEAGADRAAQPVPPAERGSELEILRRFLAGLNRVDRAVFLMYLDDLSHQEMAAVTGLSVSHVGVKIHRVKQAFIDQYVTS